MVIRQLHVLRRCCHPRLVLLGDRASRLAIARTNSLHDTLVQPLVIYEIVQQFRLPLDYKHMFAHDLFQATDLNF